MKRKELLVELANARSARFSAELAVKEALAECDYWFGVTDMRERLLAEQRDKLERIREALEGPHVNCAGPPEDAMTIEGCFVRGALLKIKAAINV